MKTVIGKMEYERERQDFDMVKSMTGFGRYEYTDGDKRYNIEIKSVNHRYLELNIKMPKKLSFFESDIRNLVKGCVTRGKVDIFITYDDIVGGSEEVKYNDELAGEYIKIFKEMSQKYNIDNDATVTTLLSCQDVFEIEEKQIDENEIWAGLEKALAGAMERFLDMRVSEGENLKKDLLDKLDCIDDMVVYIESKAPDIVSEYRKKIEGRMEELLGSAGVEHDRIVTETVIFADRICVDEEIVRLKSHVNTMKEALKKGGVIGRKLDFIAQEMNREATTVLSKTTDLDITNHGIDLKTDIEKIREQIQNIE